MAVSSQQISPTQALDFHCQSYAEGSVQLPQAIGLGTVSSGGFVAAVATKIAALYAAGHDKLSKQTDVRSSTINFVRPVIPSKGPVSFKTDEVSIGRAWSTLRVEISQAKLCAVVDVLVTNFAIPGLTLNTGWTLNPPPILPRSLAALEDGSDPAWTCYQTAFHAHGFRRGHGYIKNYIPLAWPNPITHVDQYIVPGWDCHPQGSRDPSLPEARWTNELLPFAVDNHLPVQENYLPTKPGERLPNGSIAATLGFAAEQKQAREQGRSTWRDVDGDGAIVFGVKAIHSTLRLTCEVKKKLPDEGVRFLFVRAVVKSIVKGRLDYEVLLFDESMELVLIGHQVAQLVEATTKDEKAAL